MFDIITLNDMLVSELKEIATKLDINSKGLKKQDLIYKILEEQAIKTPAAPDKPTKPAKPAKPPNNKVKNLRQRMKDQRNQLKILKTNLNLAKEDRVIKNRINLRTNTEIKNSIQAINLKEKKTIASRIKTTIKSLTTMHASLKPWTTTRLLTKISVTTVKKTI